MMTTTEALTPERHPNTSELQTRVCELAAEYYPAFDEDPTVRLTMQPLGVEVPNTPKGYEVAVLDCSELPSGSFKRLGAMISIAEAQKNAAEKGEHLKYVTAATDGNHGKAVQSVAEELGLATKICVPSFVDEERLQYFVEPDSSFETLEDAKGEARHLGEQAGGAYIEPFDSEAMLAGGGYLSYRLAHLLQANESLAQYASIRATVATAGGGLTAGCDIVLNRLGLGRSIELYGAQLNNCDPAARSLHNRPPLARDELDTSCTSTALLRAGQKPLSSLRDSMLDDTKAFQDIEVVTREQLGEAMLIYEQTYGRTGPAASLALAAAIKQMRELGEPVDGQRHLMVVVRCADDDVTDEIYESYTEEVGEEFKLELKKNTAERARQRQREEEIAKQITAFQKLSTAYAERDVSGLDEIIKRQRGADSAASLQVGQACLQGATTRAYVASPLDA